MPLGALGNKLTPRVRPSELRVSEPVDCEMPSARAARVCVPASTTAAKTRRCRSSSSVFTARIYHWHPDHRIPIIGIADRWHRRFGAWAPRPYGRAMLPLEPTATTLLVVDLPLGFAEPRWARRT